jgi:L-ascorbate 6-phosphate lactonase
MSPSQIDFDPEEPIAFPVPVPHVMSSRDYMAAIRATPVPAGQLALWFLGQNSFILKGPGRGAFGPASTDGLLIAVDPYLSDWCASKDSGERQPKSRLLPVFVEPEDFEVDLVLISHSHPDHCDPSTLRRLACKASARFLAPWQCLPLLAGAGVPEAQVTLMHPLQAERVGDAEVTAVFALPTDASDLNHVGYVVRLGGKTYYNSGDTAWHELLGHVRGWQPDLMSVCINGGYHNLSHWEAARVAAAVKPRIAVPAHYDMMPHNLQPPHMFRKSLWEQDRDIVYHRMEYWKPFFF